MKRKKYGMISEVTGQNARALLMGCACVVTSRLTLEQLEKFCVYLPEALELKDEDGEVIYAIDFSDETPGRVSDDMTVYSRAVTADGRPTATILIDPECADRKNAVRESIGLGLALLETLECRLEAMLPELAEAERKAWIPSEDAEQTG